MNKSFMQDLKLIYLNFLLCPVRFTGDMSGVIFSEAYSMKNQNCSSFEFLIILALLQKTYWVCHPNNVINCNAFVF